jgi:hypothetical protein
VSDSVLIEQVRCRYRIRRWHSTAAEIRWRLDHVVRDRLPALCHAGLADRVPSGPGIVIIRSLDLKLVLRRRLNETRAAELWSRGIAVALARALAEEDRERIVRFDSRADRLAELCADLAAGTAWSRWYHASFSALKGSSTTSAIRRVLAESPGEIAATLGILRRRGRLRQVARSLADDDAWAIVAAVPTASAGPAARQLLGPELLREALAAGRPASVVLELLAVLAEAGGVTDRNVRIVSRLARAAPLLLAQHAGGRLDGGDASQQLRVLSAEEPELVRAAGAAVSGQLASAPDVAGGESEFVTAFGGIFLLLPAIAEFDVERRLRAGGLGDDEAVRAAGVGRWLVALKCLEPSERLAARFDPGLAVAAGIGSAADAAALRRLGRLTTPPVAAALAEGTAATTAAHFRTPELLRTKRADTVWSRVAATSLGLLARRLPGFEASSPGHLARNFLAGPSHVRITEKVIDVSLPRTPLQVVLRVAGWGGSVHAVPWLPGGVMTIAAEAE